MKKEIKRRPLLIIGLLVLMAVSGLIVAKWLVARKNQQAQSSEVSETAKQESGKKDDKKENEGAQLKNDDSDTAGQTPKQYEGENPNNSEGITGYISHNAVSGDVLRLRVVINQMMDNTGNCELILSSKESGSVVKKTTKTVSGPTTGTCEGFDIPISELGSGGWGIEIKIDANGKSGIIRGEVSI